VLASAPPRLCEARAATWSDSASAAVIRYVEQKNAAAAAIGDAGAAQATPAAVGEGDNAKKAMEAYMKKHQLTEVILPSGA